MTTRWSFELLDSEDRPLGELDGVTGGSCEIVAQSQLGGSASISINERGQGIDWMSDRLRIWYHRDDVVSWPVGTYLFTSPTANHTAFGTTYQVGLLTKMSIVNEDTVLDRYSLAAGALIIPTVVALIQSTGEARVAVTDSVVELTSPITWEAGTSKLRIINDLLQAAGYWSLWCDGSGQFRVEPYVDPSRRSPVYEFRHGEDSLHFPDWGREQDMTSVPNRIVLITSGSDSTATLMGVAENNDPASPFSIPSRGRVISPPSETVEAASQEVIDALAERRLRDAMSPVARLTVTHAMLDLNPDELVGFTPEDGVRRLATIQRMSMGFTFDTVIAAEWREVL